MFACWIQHWHNIAPDEEDHHDNHDQDDNDDGDDDGDDHHNDDDHRDQPDDDHHYEHYDHDNQDQVVLRKWTTTTMFICQSVPMSLNVLLGILECSSVTQMLIGTPSKL